MNSQDDSHCELAVSFPWVCAHTASVLWAIHEITQRAHHAVVELSLIAVSLLWAIRDITRWAHLAVVAVSSHELVSRELTMFAHCDVTVYLTVRYSGWAHCDHGVGSHLHWEPLKQAWQIFGITTKTEIGSNMQLLSLKTITNKWHTQFFFLIAVFNITTFTIWYLVSLVFLTWWLSPPGPFLGAN